MEVAQERTQQYELTDARHPELNLGPGVAVYVWPYSIRLIHWGIVISIGVLSVTGYYIHDPFIVGQEHHPFLMAVFRFVHETFGMILIALFLYRIYLFFYGNRWLNWRSYVPLRASQWQEMMQVMKFYFFINPKPVTKIGHNAMAAASYIAVYTMLFIELVTGLVMFNWLRHSTFLGLLVGWVPRLISIQNVRLIHFFLMYLFFAFAVIHIHLCMLISREEKRGLMDSMFIGYKVIPEAELEKEEKKAEVEESLRHHR